ncbi:uncharacterized protein BDR25DRAFT_45136 [Lindgomyces ingoldianus]|uniref:Uncharacterized protein n=1 Tax=Lindgomyces ingoldianus TaxID=673940 RepID=A0ACB6REZ0_9PLEO|nr:uncharacterized protein BDR25DRAFT_45136 [Lindgomyces ingoldianus]KAF2477280.1 hypothetical protein BDR25DRAFT_45136 [Lindgomyces ingoldianus]
MDAHLQPFVPTLAPSPLFMIPPELRLLIYEFVFGSPPEHVLAPPRSSLNLEPLLTCRQLYVEAKLLAFAHTTHNINWLPRASLTCQRRLLVLEPTQIAHIRHVSINTSAAGLYESLQPFRCHFDHIKYPALRLDSLTIILDLPDTSATTREHRVRELNMVLTSIWYYKNVRKVVLLNVLHREALNRHPTLLGRWSCMDCDKGIATNEMRWRFELTSFYDYAWKPWHIYLHGQARPNVPHPGSRYGMLRRG